MPGRPQGREFTLMVVRQGASGEQCPAQICREHNLDESVLLRRRKEEETRLRDAIERLVRQLGLEYAAFIYTMVPPVLWYASGRAYPHS